MATGTDETATTIGDTMDKINELMADADRRASDTDSPETAMYWRGRKDAYAIVLKLQQRDYENSYEPSYVQ